MICRDHYITVNHQWNVFICSNIFTPSTISVERVGILCSNCSVCVYSVNEKTNVCFFLSLCVCVAHFTVVLFVYRSIIRLLAALSETLCCTRTEGSPGDTYPRLSWYCFDFFFLLTVSLSGWKHLVYFRHRKTTCCTSSRVVMWSKHHPCKVNKVSHLLVFMCDHMETQNQRCLFTNVMVVRVCMCVIMGKYRPQCDHTGPVSSKRSHVVSNSRFKSL